MAGTCPAAQEIAIQLKLCGVLLSIDGRDVASFEPRATKRRAAAR